MNTICPCDAHIPGLRALWKDAFGDTDEFLDIFFSTAYAPERCRCILEDGVPAAALYWFDCTLDGAKLAYIYAVATAPAHRGKGLCKTLMRDALAALTTAGYDGAVLVPQEPWLIDMYRRMGFAPCSATTETHVMAAETAIPVRPVGPAEYARLRRQLLPAGSVIQEGENLRFLAAQAVFYAGENWLAATTEVDGMLWCPEFLGDISAAPGLVKALGCREGSFRMPGSERPFAMFRPLSKDCPQPAYFGLAFD